MGKMLNAKVGEIEDEVLRELIVELQSACGIEASPETMLCHFLALCVYPHGTGTKRVPISTDHLAVSPLLEMRIRDLPGGAMSDLCRELARNDGLESSEGEELRSFLNRRIPVFLEHKPPSETAQRKDMLMRMRRKNR